MAKNTIPAPPSAREIADKENARAQQIAEANETAKRIAAGGKSDAELAAEPDETEQPDPPLSPEAQAEQNRILGLSEAEIAADERPEFIVEAEEALKKLRRIFAAYPPTTPNEHVCFGNGGGKFTLGDFRALVRVMPPE